MNKSIAFFLLCLTLIAGNQLFARDYLKDRIPSGNFREGSYRHCFELLENRGAKILVETGTARDGCKNCGGDGCSTVIFADWARDHGATLFSVDISEKAIQESRKAVRKINKNVHFAV